MKTFKDLKLLTKLMSIIFITLIFFTILDIKFNTEKETDIMVSEIEDWAFLFAENTRIALNTLMRDGKMDLRFEMFSSMGSELKGLQNVRVIRSERINELFNIANKRDVIPKVFKALETFKAEIEGLRRRIKKTKDPLEKEDFQNEISTLKREIKIAQERIQKAKKIKEIDAREQARDHLDREVLKNGQPIYLYEGDTATALIPYAVKKGCGKMSGCHKYAKQGEVLGAIRLEFSTKGISDQIHQNNIATVQLGVIKFLIILVVVAAIVYIFVIKRFKLMQSAFEKVAAGDLTVRLNMNSRDELGILGGSFNKMADDLQGTTVSRDLLNKEIDERKLIEVDLKKAKKEAETANRAKSDFLANMSHELRTPLTAITGFSEILKDGISGNINDHQSEFIHDIYNSSLHLLSLINDILDLSKIESGNMHMEITEVNVKELIEKSQLFIKNKILSGNLKLTAETDANIGVISADERLLKQVLINLLSNAAKFTPERGCIKIGAKKVEGESGSEDMIEIFVEDTGIGIKQEDLSLICEPFKQIESMLTKKYQGTGLGLSICKDIIEMHGGCMRVESEWEKGSKFTFTLPTSKNKKLDVKTNL